MKAFRTENGELTRPCPRGIFQVLFVVSSQRPRRATSLTYHQSLQIHEQSGKSPFERSLIPTYTFLLTNTHIWSHTSMMHPRKRDAVLFSRHRSTERSWLYPNFARAQLQTSTQPPPVSTVLTQLSLLNHLVTAPGGSARAVAAFSRRSCRASLSLRDWWRSIKGLKLGEHFTLQKMSKCTIEKLREHLSRYFQTIMSMAHPTSRYRMTSARSWS